MALTHEDLQILRAPFTVDEHEFHRGFAYVAELAICRRLEAIDPSYEFRVNDVIIRDRQITARASLTINGVTRENVGMATVEYTKNDPDRESNEAEKSATTDALKRCARLFGIGQYLLELPESVKTFDALAKFLGQAPQRRTQAPPPAQSNGNGKAQGQTALCKAAVSIRLSGDTYWYNFVDAADGKTQYATGKDDTIAAAYPNLVGQEGKFELPAQPIVTFTTNDKGKHYISAIDPQLPASGLTREEAEELKAFAEDLNYKAADVLATLEIERLSQWPGTLQAAKDALQAAINF